MSESYDAIVIGSGLGGLTAGALYATEGKRVLVLERNSSFGGAASVFRRGKLLVEAGLHEIDGLDDDDMKMWTLDKLGVREGVEFLEVPDLYSARHPLFGDDFVMPHGQDRVIQTSIERFPEHADAIRTYFGTLYELRTKITRMTKTKSPIKFLLANAFGLLIPFRYWPIIRHDRTTLGAYLDQLFGDDEAIKLALAANFGYYTDDPTNFSLIFYAAAQASFLTGGGYYIKGGSRSLVDHLIGVIENAGGEAVSGRTVNQILVESGKAVGVVHQGSRNDAGEQQVRAPVLFGNAAPGRLGEMLPEPRRERFLEQYRRLTIGTSLWAIYLGLNRDPAELGIDHYSTFILPSWLDRLDRAPESSTLLANPPGQKLPTYVMVNYGIVDGGLGDGQTKMVAIAGCDRLDNYSGLDKSAYKERKAAWTDAIIADVDRNFPGFASHIDYQEMATARTMERYLGTPDGAVYGFAQPPLAAGRYHVTAKTGVPGLLLSSAFAAPGGGFTGAMLAGERAYWAARKLKR
ncbi:MAG: NAD(P)/FAD-dependent oxidoreductase [Deltaproteobacteria bacterium]|nr:NAD(P)/FAD-dependent oxidoreductase [Deltaproteobacteria bacterium]